MLKDFQKQLKKFGLESSESFVSMVLGAIVVILVAILAYGYFKNHQPAASITTPPAENEGELTNPTATVALPTNHLVSAGENLWSIAEKYYRSGYNYVDIAAANNLSDSNNLEAGQTLTIPNVTVRLPLTVATVLQPEVTATPITGTSYTVVAGDNLWVIALRAYGDSFRWPDIATANQLANPDLIFAGNVFQIPR